MKKRLTAVLLTLALAAALLPGTAQAAQNGRSAGARLTGVDRQIYNVLLTEVTAIAAGERSSTTVHIPDLPSLSWTLEELGLSGRGNENTLSALADWFDRHVHMYQIIHALMMDCPYEMYWADNQFTWGYSSVQRGNEASIKNLTVYLQAAQGYRDGSDATSVSADKAAAAQRASDRAKAIVEKYQDLSDLEKLTAYRDEICRLVSYETSTYRTDLPYGDVWQLVYVFDGDPKTNVVCEGYAKAFKYLCDLSEFEGDVACWLASGKMDGGNHMWNVVRMDDGRNYLVDVTNSDNGTVGETGLLFLVGGAASDGGQTVTVVQNDYQMTYTYGDDLRDLLCDGFLPISAADYEEPEQPVSSPEPTPSGEPDDSTAATAFTDVDPGEWYAQPVAWAVEREITNGTTSTTFSPGQPCTHGQILTFLWRAAGEPEPAGQAPAGTREEDFFYDAVRWAAGEGMLSQQFNPRAGCSRADAVRYIWSAFQCPEADAPAAFTDVPAGASYEQAVAWAVEKEVTTGTSDTTFDPNTICSRGHIVTFLYRAYH